MEAMVLVEVYSSALALATNWGQRWVTVFLAKTVVTTDAPPFAGMREMGDVTVTEK